MHEDSHSWLRHITTQPGWLGRSSGLRRWGAGPGRAAEPTGKRRPYTGEGPVRRSSGGDEVAGGRSRLVAGARSDHDEPGFFSASQAAEARLLRASVDT
jgi:hypothetical protein